MITHPLVPDADVGAPLPPFANKNVPHRTYMSRINTAAEEVALAADEPKSKFGEKQPLGALTMVYRDYDLLERWYNYYKEQIGAENIYIYSHGNDPKHREIAEGENVMNVPRDESFRLFEVNRWRMMGFFASAMLEFYRYMIVSDVDEFVVADPQTGMTAAEYIAHHYSTPKALKKSHPSGSRSSTFPIRDLCRLNGTRPFCRAAGSSGPTATTANPASSGVLFHSAPVGTGIRLGHAICRTISISCISSSSTGRSLRIARSARKRSCKRPRMPAVWLPTSTRGTTRSPIITGSSRTPNTRERTSSRRLSGSG